MSEQAEVDERDAPPAARVLVIFGNIPLLGQERGNIQVFKALKGAVDALFVTHKEYGYEIIQPTLDALGLRWTPATYPRLFSRGMDLRTWLKRLREVAVNNWEFLRAARAYRPTHVHVGNEAHLLGLLPALWLVRVPVVFRLGDEPRQHRPLFRAIWRRLLIPRVSQFVCVSEFIRGKLLEAGAPPERVRVIYSFPADRSVRPENHDVEPEPFDGVTVAYMGQLSVEKGVDLLVEAAITLCETRDDVRFLIAGDYTWQNPFAKALIQRVEALGLRQRIQFLGYVKDVPRLLAEAELHVCPSVWEEPLSNTLVEAKRAGVPSIVFRSGGLPELVQHRVDGYVCAEKTAAALRDGIESFLSEGSEARREAGRQARRSLETLGITRGAFASRWLAVYRDAAADRPASYHDRTLASAS